MIFAANVVISNVLDSLFGAVASVWPQLIIAAGTYAAIIIAARLGFSGLWGLAKRLGQIMGLPVVIDRGEGKLSEEALIAALEEPHVRKNRDTGDALWYEAATEDLKDGQGGLALMNESTGNAAWWEAAQAHAGLNSALGEPEVEFASWDNRNDEPRSSASEERVESEPGADWRSVPYDDWTDAHHRANNRWWNSDDDDTQADAA